nr:MAG TPA: resistance protein [Caudoviricetes sp.]
MSTLYEINEQILRCVKDGDMVVDTETGEVIDAAALDALQMARDEKLTNIGKWILDLKADAKAIREREISLAERRKAKENKAEQLMDYMNMILAGKKFECADFKASYRKSQAVEVTDAEKIPAPYLIIQEPKVDKAGIKKALKAGEEVPGAKLVERNNLSIR